VAVAVLWWRGDTRRTIRSRILEERRAVLVHLPPGYHESRSHYPVLYLLDAVGRPSRFSPALSEIGEKIDAMAGEGVGPLIVIGVVNTRRGRDMLPVEAESYPESGGADRFLACLTEEIIPYVDETFRTTGERLLYGRWDSGLLTLYALLEAPEAFSGYIASSPTVGHCPDLLATRATRLFTERQSLVKSLFVIYGDDDIPLTREFVPDLAQVIRERGGPGLRLQVKVVPGGGHIPATSLADGLRFHFSHR
jgi:predicted alpha/beta superfamily hydrolase